MNEEAKGLPKDSAETLTASITRVMGEAPHWQHLMNQDADATLTVYLDLKSPHAYLAVRPTLEVAKDYRVKIDFRPYTLSYTGLGISSSVELDKRRRPPSAAADRKARMYYAAAREYAALQGLPLRSPHRLLDSELAHRAFVYAKHQSLEVPFMMSVYLQGWGSGWRNYELESLLQLRSSLAGVGSDNVGFDAFVRDQGLGQQQLVAHMEEANASGFVGAPHYVFYDKDAGRQVGLFGREHLALIRGKFAAQGLARRAEVRAEFSHAWDGPES